MSTPSPSPDELKRMREKSGSIQDNRPLVRFFYKLMRDEMTPGKVEQLLLESGIDEPVKTPKMAEFTNGWLAQIAQDITYRLTGWDAPWPVEGIPPDGIPVSGGIITTKHNLSPEEVAEFKRRFNSEQTGMSFIIRTEDDPPTDG